MKVILYMALSANGMIAKTDDDTSWISKEEWGSFSDMVRSAGCMIIGHRTYDIITKQPEFTELKEVKVIVLSGKEFETIAPNHLVAHSPNQALELLKDFPTVIVAGGGILNASFLEQNLVDEVFLDIEPMLFGEGIPVSKGKDFTKNLKLLGQKKIGEDGIQLHYEISK